MPTETDCCNIALGKIGANRITGLDEESINGRWCATFFPPLRDSILRMHHWNFASGRAELAQLVEPPVFEFGFRYQLPSDFLKMREYYGSGTSLNSVPFDDLPYVYPYVSRYTIEENNTLLTNDTAVWITYTKRVTNLDLWDAMAFMCLATWLASDLCNAIPKDVSKAKSLLDEAVSLLLPLAASVDGQEGTVLPFMSNDLLLGR